MIGLGVGLINAVVFGGIFGVMGAILLAYGWQLNRRPGSNPQNPGWVAVKGKVISATVNRSQPGGMGYVRVTFVPVIEYSYEANGQVFQANNQATAQGTNSVTAQRIADRHKPGTAVNVRYNPNRPSESILEVTAANGNFYMTAGIGLLIFACILACGILAFSVVTSGGVSGLFPSQ